MRIGAKFLIAALLVHGLIACGDDGDDTSNNDLSPDVGADVGSDVGGPGDDETSCTVDDAEEFSDDVRGEEVVLGRCTVVTERVSIESDGKITVEPGSTVLFERRAGFWLKRDGAVNAVGTADEPILFTGVDKEPGAWRTIFLEGSDEPDNVFEHVTIEYGGGEGARAALRMIGESILTMRNSTIRHSESAGFEFPNGEEGEVRAFEGNTVTDNAVAGLTGAIKAGDIDASNTLSGNDEDWVRLIPEGAPVRITEDSSFAALDVPYLMTAGLRVNGDAAWTVEAGADIAMEANTGIVIGHDAAITFNGTEEKPITLRGAEQAPGFWNRLYIEKSGSTNNLFRHTVIADAGGGGNSSAAALSLGSGRNATLRLTLDTVAIRDSAGHGVYANSGYEGAFDVSGCETFSFENVAGDEFAGDGFCGEDGGE